MPLQSDLVGLDIIAFKADADIGVFGAKKFSITLGTQFVFEAAIVLPPIKVVHLSQFHL
jgi:hypothetical protein